MDELSRKRWIATHILPLEAQARRWLTRHVRSLSGSDADDLIQESFYRIWMTDLSTIQSPAAYLYVILRNLLLQQSRHAKVIPMERMGEIDELSIPIDERAPDRTVSARQDLDRISRIVDVLPEQCRRVFELRKLEGLSQREVMDRMGISERTVEKHLAKALGRVMQMRANEEGTEARHVISGEKTDGTRNERD